MAWVKLDDAMPHHPKVMAAGPQGFALDVAGICYSNKHATDGFIPRFALAAVCPSLQQPSKWARKLVEVGRWIEVEGGWRIHDIGDFQPSAADQKALSKKRAEAGRNGGLQSGRSRREANPKQIARTEANPVPTRPDQTKEAAAFEVFHKQRAVVETQRRKARGRPIDNVTGYANAIADDATFRTESERIWQHRDCSACKGTGSQSLYSEGSGGIQVPCREAT